MTTNFETEKIPEKNIGRSHVVVNLGGPGFPIPPPLTVPCSDLE